MNPIYFAIPAVLLFGYLIFISNQYTSLELIIFICFLAVIAMVGTQYFLGVNLTASIQHLFTKPEVDISILQKQADNPDKPKPKPFFPLNPLTKINDEVYHVKGQFDYANAKAVCKAYNGKLATISQMENAYDKGAEWCAYGWSDDHMALYPTQTASWKEYQETDNPEQCGRPGVNGGYNNILSQKLGANCFGKKPPKQGPLPPPPIQQKAVDSRAEYWKSMSSVSPFNYTQWND